MDIEKIITRVGIHSIVLNKDNQFLVLKRSEIVKHGSGCWDLPGGHTEIDENPINGLNREIKEETNLSVANIRLIGSYTCKKDRLQLCAISEMAEGELELMNI